MNIFEQAYQINLYQFNKVKLGYCVNYDIDIFKYMINRRNYDTYTKISLEHRTSILDSYDNIKDNIA